MVGRLEVVGEIHGASIVIDYAHKPDAMESALDALRPFVAGRLINVFGCGGDRDPGKRPLMGAISAEKADITIITDDNPRSEDPEQVRAAILAAVPDATEIGGRYEAIAAALAMAGPGDVVLIAGKGHETGQIVGDRVLCRFPITKRLPRFCGSSNRNENWPCSRHENPGLERGRARTASRSNPY